MLTILLGLVSAAEIPEGQPQPTAASQQPNSSFTTSGATDGIALNYDIIISALADYFSGNIRP